MVSDWVGRHTQTVSLHDSQIQYLSIYPQEAKIHIYKNTCAMFIYNNKN